MLHCVAFLGSAISKRITFKCCVVGPQLTYCTFMCDRRLSGDVISEDLCLDRKVLGELRTDGEEQMLPGACR